MGSSSVARISCSRAEARRSSASAHVIARRPVWKREVPQGYTSSRGGQCSSVGRRQHHRARAEAQKATAGIFPAGKKQATVPIPSVFLECTVDDVLDNEQNKQAIELAVRAGATAVVLSDSPGSSAGAKLYDAALQLKGLLRGRALLLVRDRADMASAAEADGLLISSGGVPIVVARRMMQDAGVLVGSTCRTGGEAGVAAADGASMLLLVDATPELVAESRGAQKAQPIPVIAEVSSPEALQAIAEGCRVDGIAIPLSKVASSPEAAVASLLRRISGSGPAKGGGEQGRRGEEGRANGKAEAGAKGALSGTKAFRPGSGHLLSESAESLMAREKAALAELLDLLEEACPAMDERMLLKDALKQLEELFLVVVVGEFNSGKSSVINALLGGTYLATGILPTTNEISVLKYGPEGSQDVYQEADGLFVRTLPAELLKEVSVVDTPGTNVILGRQQRLTEEYVPRADLVLFVLSADRPFTDSEVGFLKYIRQWGKKVVFVVNKVDQLGSEEEVAQLTAFIKDNAASILGVEDSPVLPVSARKALAAKDAARGAASDATGVLSTVDAEGLRGSEEWRASRFEALEEFLVVFLGGGDGAGEVVRLKLQTPLSVAGALLDAAERVLDGEMAVVVEDLASVDKTRRNMERFRAEMKEDSDAQVARVREAIDVMYQNVARVVDNVLQISAWQDAIPYLSGAPDPSRLPVARALRGGLFGGAAEQVEALAAEHTDFVRSNCVGQLEAYVGWAEGRCADLGVGPAQRAPLKALQSGAGATGTAQRVVSAIREYNEEEAVASVEEGAREAVVTTATYLGGAGAGLVLLTTIMQTGLEDLLSVLLCGGIVYAGIITLPLRRARVKEAAKAQIGVIQDKVASLMAQELEEGVNEVVSAVSAAIAPIEENALREKERLERLSARLERARVEMDALRGEVARFN